ncbi:MAG: xylulokinase [Anaerolineae bacterium]|jgi:xylulokinase
MKELILAHDLGTTGNKATLLDGQGQVLGSAFSPYETQYGSGGRAEQNPEDWWRAVVASTRQLLAQSRRQAAEIAAVGCSGQMMACLPVDRTGRPLSSALIWADQRAHEQATWIADQVGEQEIYRITGHRASPSYTAAKWLWHRAHYPDLVQSTRWMLQAKDYVVHRLTGVFATDYSDASGTNLFDLNERQWSVEIMDKLGLPMEVLPPAVPSSTVVGGVTRSAAKETGLQPDTPVVIGGGDGACATAGAGVLEPSDAYNYIGSSSWISIVTREPLLDPQRRTFTFAHLDPRYVFPTGTMQCAGGSYDWLERLLRGEQDQPAYQELDRLAGSVPVGARRLLYLPYLIGERSPHWNPRARGAFLGLGMEHGRAELARAVLEGVAFNLRTIFRAFRAQGAVVPALRVIGGGARSALWRQILADVLEVPLLRAELPAEATALGAAMAAAVGVGLLGSYADGAAWVRVTPGEVPDAARAAAYLSYYELFLQAYRALEPLYDGLSNAQIMGGVEGL